MNAIKIMMNENIDRIIPFVEKPSSYLGTEINAVVKSGDQVKLSMALAFPDLYEIGTSHFGLQIIYEILNNHKSIAAERVYTPGIDLENKLREKGEKLFSLETKKTLDTFDILGFSLLYELNNTNVLTMMDLAGIPFFASERGEDHPIVIAGGPCTCNPEPVADFFDAIIVGDGEEVVLAMCEAYIAAREKGATKQEILKIWSELEGVYIPSYFSVSYEDGVQRLTPIHDNYTGVRRTVIKNLDGAAFPENPVVPFGKPVHDRLRLEVGRGCSRGCRFCQAGMIYRPVRERSLDDLLAIADASMKNTGYNDISLLSLSTGDYGCISGLMEQLMKRYAEDHVSISLPSIRAGKLTPELMNIIKKVRKTGFTIAPEAGTQRLRDVINKGIDEEQITSTVENAFKLGWKVMKLYFMIGHPTETMEDIDGIIATVKKLKDMVHKMGKKPQINVSVTTFIPKPHTPFQWAGQISLEESLEKIFYLKKRLDIRGVKFKFQSPEISVLEGIFARGDRRLAKKLVEGYSKGCKFDGWSEHFKFNVWKEVFSEEDFAFYVHRTKALDEPLPWDHVDIRVTKKYLQKEWKKALTCELTHDCRQGDCTGCGVCDFKEYMPRVFDNYEETPNVAVKTDEDVQFKRLRVFYSKTGPARFFGHLELVNIFTRALKRAGVPVKFSEGFHPLAKIAFDDPLPVGMESCQEFFTITVPAHYAPSMLAESVNTVVPEGISVTGFTLAGKKIESNDGKYCEYQIMLADGSFEEKDIDDFNSASEFIYSRTNKKRKTVTIDLKEVVKHIKVVEQARLELCLNLIKGKSVRPAVILKEIFGLSEDQVKTAWIRKIKIDE